MEIDATSRDEIGASREGRRPTAPAWSPLLVARRRNGSIHHIRHRQRRGRPKPLSRTAGRSARTGAWYLAPRSSIVPGRRLFIRLGEASRSRVKGPVAHDLTGQKGADRVATSGRTVLPTTSGSVVGVEPRLAPGDLREALARALRDPALELGFWLPEHEAFVDPEGRPITLPAGGGGSRGHDDRGRRGRSRGRSRPRPGAGGRRHGDPCRVHGGRGSARERHAGTSSSWRGSTR